MLAGIDIYSERDQGLLLVFSISIMCECFCDKWQRELQFALWGEKKKLLIGVGGEILINHELSRIVVRAPIFLKSAAKCSLLLQSRVCRKKIYVSLMGAAECLQYVSAAKWSVNGVFWPRTVKTQGRN